jgi:pyrroline-5-carboxylate reductase
MVFKDVSVSFIGSGAMAEAMIAGLLNKRLIESDQIIGADPREDRGDELTARYAIRTTTDNAEAAKAADILVLSVKPQVFDEVALSVREHTGNVKMVLSILAGVKISTIADGLQRHSVVRAMPNTPAQIGEGITVWTATSEVPEEQRTQAGELLRALGEEIYMADEKFLDMATALSGTGPAYVFLFMEALIDAGVHMGFSRRDAEQLVMQTIRGSVDFARASGRHPAELRNQVTSPGGTSAEAIYHLEKGGLRTVIARSVWAAYQRSVSLGGGSEVRQPDELENDR